ncbi:ferredoxin [Candidatus Pacearchaeota archaeon CG10_big_fil_rev_8_21_14_0_10_35_13]|nr:MAG: ferredoxin [Candidatus Pacearchaeota archaeon CG10_big_fil_rev_8_21_14_0_10_35_13]
MGNIKIGGDEVFVDDGGSIIDACESLGVLFSCQEGTCGTCEVEVVNGAENLTSPTSAEEMMGVDIEGNKRLACQCKLKSGDVELTYDL